LTCGMRRPPSGVAGPWDWISIRISLSASGGKGGKTISREGKFGGKGCGTGNWLLCFRRLGTVLPGWLFRIVVRANGSRFRSTGSLAASPAPGCLRFKRTNNNSKGISMKRLIKGFIASGLAVALALLLTGPARAAQINGTLTLSSIGKVTGNGVDLGASSQVTATMVVSTAATGDFAIVPPLTDYGPTTLKFSNPPPAGHTTGTVIAPFTFSNVTYGTFTSTSGTFTRADDPSGQFVNVELVGTYSGLPGFQPTPANVTVTLTQPLIHGKLGAISETISLVAEPNATPEPSTLVLACLGGVPFAFAGFRRWRRKDAAQKPLTV